jgi:large subunit ribosomal protein L29
LELDELKQMNAGDLRVKEREAREEIFRLKLKLRTNQLDNPSNYRRARKELARIMTLLRQKSGPGAGADGAAAPAKASDARAS